MVVDGVTYPKECVIWEINGKDYTVDELAEAGSDFWRITDTAVLKIPKEGCSYMPPFMDIFDEDGDDRSFNGGTYTRENMIIV